MRGRNRKCKARCKEPQEAHLLASESNSMFLPWLLSCKDWHQTPLLQAKESGNGEKTKQLTPHNDQLRLDCHVGML